MPFHLDIRSWIIDVRKESKTCHLKSTIQRQRRLGFTLIELLVVISIIAILLAVATVSYNNAQQKGRDNRRKTDLKAVQQALELYFQQNGNYPDIASTGNIACDGGSAISWGTGNFTCNYITYMNILPKDPVANTPTQYYYYSENSATPENATYKIFAKIENTKDQDLASSPAACETDYPTHEDYATSGVYYCVTNP